MNSYEGALRNLRRTWDILLGRCCQELEKVFPRIKEGRNVPEGLSWKHFKCSQHSWTAVQFRRGLCLYRMSFELWRLDEDEKDFDTPLGE